MHSTLQDLSFEVLHKRVHPILTIFKNPSDEANSAILFLTFTATRSQKVPKKVVPAIGNEEKSRNLPSRKYLRSISIFLTTALIVKMYGKICSSP